MVLVGANPRQDRSRQLFHARLLVALYGKRRRPRVAGLCGLIVCRLGRRRRFICDRRYHLQPTRCGADVKRTIDVCLARGTPL